MGAGSGSLRSSLAGACSSRGRDPWQLPPFSDATSPRFPRSGPSVPASPRSLRQRHAPQMKAARNCGIRHTVNGGIDVRVNQ